MKSASGPNWAWKPEKIVRSAIRLGDKKTDPLRETKAKREAARKADKSNE
jgi:hypothetical protein